MGVHVDEEILEKTGGELFRELIRVYPVADIEDYIKNGYWKDDQMRTDLVLIYAHAREAGAPYPPPLKDVKMPPLPQGMPMPKPQAAATPPGAGAPLGFGAAGPRPLMTATVKPPPAAGAVAPKAATPAAAAAAGQTTELRLIALFVAKWKLDPNRTKLILAKLMPNRRRYVIQSFKTPAVPDPTSALEQFIASCEKTGVWDAAPAPAAGAAQPVAVKRPLAPAMMAMDPSKRPRMMAPGAVAPKAVAAFRPVAAVRPAFGAPPGGFGGFAGPRPVRPVSGIRPVPPQRF